MNFRNNSSSGARSGIPGLYVTSAQSMEYDRGSGARSRMSGLSVTLAKSMEYGSGSGAYFGMPRRTTASFKSRTSFSSPRLEIFARRTVDGDQERPS